MNIFELIKASIESIKSNKMRASFTMFGIIVGITSVMMITSIGDGLRSTINSQFEDFGLDEITISHTSQVRPVQWNERLNLTDAIFLRNHHHISHVTSTHNITIQNAIYELGTTDVRGVQLQGSDGYRGFFAGNALAHGRHINQIDVYNRNPVAIIDESAAISIFGTSYAVGRTLEIRTNAGTRFFEVVGILESDDSMQMVEMFRMPFEIRVPITITQELANAGDVVSEIIVRLYDEGLASILAPSLINIIETRKNAHDIFQANSPANMVAIIGDVIGLFTVFLTAVASISLLVGGIGVMNIMLVSVTERTREIGIKKSLGATNTTIQLGFLIEAMVLTLIGGITGIILGLLGAAGIGYLVYILIDLELIPVIDITIISVIVLISAAIGLLFGVYPARKASMLDPVESLRFD